jgi:hypothetical protein
VAREPAVLVLHGRTAAAVRDQGGCKRPLCGLVQGATPCRFALGAGQPARTCAARSPAPS